MNERVLVVEDEPQMGRLIQTGLSARGYKITVAADAKTALDLAVRWQPDVILLDLGLPDLDGIEVCQRIRSWSEVPIIVLTVRDSEEDKVGALDSGADDYLTKPFGVNELLARIRVALRHARHQPIASAPMLQVGDIQIDLPHRLVLLRGHEIHLTPKEYDLLRVLATHAGKTLTHHMLLREVWGSTYEQDVPTLRVFITQLRQKIEIDSSQPQHILTHSGVGYRFQVVESE